MDEKLDNIEVKDQNLYTFQLIQKLSNEVTSTNTVLGNLRTEIISLTKEKDIHPFELLTLNTKVKELNDIIIEHNKLIYLNGEQSILNQLAKNSSLLQEIEDKVSDLKSQLAASHALVHTKQVQAQTLLDENNRLTRQNRLTVVIAVISGVVAIVTAIIGVAFGKK